MCEDETRDFLIHLYFDHECRRLELLDKLFTSTLFYTLIDEIEL